ncbi:hypothetical protein [Streptomyces sp. CAU 1734]|uniref:hypothetical protein n=1 Tax=Streptomyces sp. CAU 1734 TaxID=3140360 RepID=UPI0032618EC6
MTTPSPLDGRYGAAVQRVWGTVLGRVGRIWSGLDAYRDADARGFRRDALPIILAGQRNIATLTAAYLEQSYRELDPGADRVALDLDAVTGAALRGVDPNEVYERPFVELRAALSKGVPLADAIERGERRLTSITKTDLQLARTHTVREVGASMPRFEYTVRVLQGEYDCALCMIASTQRYRKRNLAPIHPGCDCLVKLVSADEDPGQIVDEALLERVHELVEDATGRMDRGGRAIDYRKIIIARQHGEIGPVLSYKDHKFTSAEDIGPMGSDGHGDEPPTSPPAVPTPPSDGPGPLGSSIYDGSGDDAPSERERQALDHAIAAIARVHGMDREMPSIPLLSAQPGRLGALEWDVSGPTALRVTGRGGWPELTVVHELGHLLDLSALGDSMTRLLSDELNPAHMQPTHPLAGWFWAVMQTRAYASLRDQAASTDDVWAVFEKDGTTYHFKPSEAPYFIQPRELFGRAYAQWIALRSGDPVLLAQLDRILRLGQNSTLISGPSIGYQRQWELDDFAPVADALDDLFEDLGLLR